MSQPNFTITPDLHASKGNRFANYIIDLIVFLAIGYGLFFLIIYLCYTFLDDTTPVDTFLDDLENINGLVDRLVTGTILALCYFTTETLLKGRSIGKFVTKTIVIKEDGSTPNTIDYLKRSFSRIIPFEAFSFLGAEGRGWHDTISKTYVVDIDKLKERMNTQNSLDQIGVPQNEF